MNTNKKFNDSFVISGFINQEDCEILYKSESMKIGKLFWKIVVYRKLNFDHVNESIISKRFGKTIDNGIYSTYVFYKEGDYFKSHWSDMKEHKNYNSNDGVYYGLPKTLVKIYYKNEKNVRNSLNNKKVTELTLF